MTAQVKYILHNVALHFLTELMSSSLLPCLAVTVTTQYTVIDTHCVVTGYNLSYLFPSVFRYLGT